MYESILLIPVLSILHFVLSVDPGYNILCGGEAYDEGLSLLEGGDDFGGDYFMLGFTSSFDVHSYGYYDAWVTRFYPNGTVNWSVLFGSEYSHDKAYRGFISRDREYLFVAGNHAYTSVFLSKIDARNGSLIFSSSVEYPLYNFAGVVTDPVSGKIFVVGENYIDGTYLFKIVVYEFDRNGTYNRGFILGHEGLYNRVRSVIPFDDGFMILSTSYVNGPMYVLMTKWNYDLSEEQWSFSYGTNENDYGTDMLLTKDGHFLISSHSYIYGCIDLELLEFNETGFEFVFTKRYCTDEFDAVALSMSEGEDIFVISGVAYSMSYNGFILVVSKENGTLLSFSFRRDLYNGFFSTAVTRSVDGVEKQVVVLGKDVDATMNSNTLIIKLDVSGLTCGLVDVMEGATESVMTGWVVVSESVSKWELGDLVVGSSGLTISDHNCSVLFESECHSCFGVDNDNQMTCYGHGDCYAWNNCSCSGGYFGETCTGYGCFGIPSSNVDTACTNGTEGVRTGVCVDYNKCVCFPGYESLYEDGPCSEWNCNGISRRKQEVCNGRGNCHRTEECDCFYGYEGTFCETWSCGVEYNQEYTCNGHGKCLAPLDCDCQAGFKGDLCDENTLYYSVMLPILLVFGTIALFIALIIGILMCCCFCAVLTFTCIVFALCVGNLGQVTWRQRKGIRKFAKLRNFELLLREQELEDDGSIAHLRINRNLFEIPFDEIETERILGEGGSSAVVFKARWNGTLVAFKCFKTRTVCQNQDKFDEFETEVAILGSLSHPNIIRFFGCTLNPPRVGIVMEYCENGELMEFIEDKREELEGGYPLIEKVRMCREISSSIQYLHSRKVIHRDLKGGNVLVDEYEICKLMDFGLSKMVDQMSKEKTAKIGTSVYMAPEVIRSGDYDERCDVYSFGVLTWVLITEELKPYGNNINVEFKVSSDPNFRPSMGPVKNITRGTRFRWLPGLIEKCWEHDPKDRCSFDDLQRVYERKYLTRGIQSQIDDDLDFGIGKKEEDTLEHGISSEELGEYKKMKELLGCLQDQLKFEEHNHRNTKALMKREIVDLQTRNSTLLKRTSTSPPPIPPKKSRSLFRIRKKKAPPPPLSSRKGSIPPMKDTEDIKVLEDKTVAPPLPSRKGSIPPVQLPMKDTEDTKKMESEDETEVTPPHLPSRKGSMPPVQPTMKDTEDTKKLDSEDTTKSQPPPLSSRKGSIPPFQPPTKDIEDRKEVSEDTIIAPPLPSRKGSTPPMQIPMNDIEEGKEDSEDTKMVSEYMTKSPPPPLPSRKGSIPPFQPPKEDTEERKEDSEEDMIKAPPPPIPSRKGSILPVQPLMKDKEDTKMDSEDTTKEAPPLPPSRKGSIPPFQPPKKDTEEDMIKAPPPPIPSRKGSIPPVQPPMKDKEDTKMDSEDMTKEAPPPLPSRKESIPPFQPPTRDTEDTKLTSPPLPLRKISIPSEQSPNNTEDMKTDIEDTIEGIE